ncbi:MAG: nucleotidyltransferase family protein [Candidatus Omnitrophica bacterium]|nr:nucleotidyltransferase family protein [Candidatus Omnitrophota bacterium]MBU1127650.1 nucleotidyltransferase family protein [Candidatus Omnitrophota bacterium]MBU1784935.1 nucleotidyltransferase family protein [Candidatus Omnitrophota bacterium]MBU1851968.1 nucleotidyltransferase family protein [Candidatus Omnitrophota bacterium]
MKGLVLAAGYGTRLYPLTLDRPKPLLFVGGRSILSRLLEKLEGVESCDEVYIVTNAKFTDLIVKWSEEHKYRFAVDVINDMTTSNDDRLGAIGDMDLVFNKKHPKDDILIIAGDNLFEFDIMNFISFARERKHFSIALFDVKDIEFARKYGIVSLDNNGKVVGFQEKPAQPESTLASTGIYYLPDDKISAFAEYIKTENPKDAPGNFVKWMSETYGVYGYVFTEGWYDIGDKISLKKADMEYREKGI